jgi:phosphoglycerol transferase MdoB-like AlkP superfamily enzyme
MILATLIIIIIVHSLGLLFSIIGFFTDYDIDAPIIHTIGSFICALVLFFSIWSISIL